MLLILISGFSVLLEPRPLTCSIEQKVHLNVVLVDDLGDVINNGTYKFKVVPEHLGVVEGDVFIPRQEGKGVIVCIANAGNQTEKGYTPVIVSSVQRAEISPSFVILNPEETEQFNVKGAEVEKWDVIPTELGKVSNGLFTAKSPGRGRVVAILKDGFVVSARIIVKGNIRRVILKPRFSKVKVGDRIIFHPRPVFKHMKFNVIPKEIGTISKYGIFEAKKPGRAFVIVRVRRGNLEYVGRALVIVLGNELARMTPERSVLKNGETIRFSVKNRTGNVSNIRWKIITKRIGRITKDGLFIAGSIPGRGKVIALLPAGYRDRILTADVIVLPEKPIFLRIYPSFIYLSGAGQSSKFNVYFVNLKKNLPVDFSVIPSDLGMITSNGNFTAKRKGIGYVEAKVKGNVLVKPGRALIIVGEQANINISPQNAIIKENSSRRFYATLNPPVPDAKFLWRVSYKLGVIDNMGNFIARGLPMGQSEITGKIFVVAYKDRELIGWGSTFIKIVK